MGAALHLMSSVLNNDFVSVGFLKKTCSEKNIVLKRSLSSAKEERITVNREIGKEIYAYS